jgi:predicted transcriptional regulator of viral defense system
MAPDERSTYESQNEHVTSKVRVGSLAGRQCGLITRAQIRALGVVSGTVARWVDAGYLIPVLPHVYAVGHRTADDRTRLLSLALFAGPDAALSHGTAAHHRGWLRYPVRAIHISTPRRIRTRFRSVVFHNEREIERELVNGIPCTTVTQTLLDVAATEPRKLVHRCLAQLDYERKLSPIAIRAACGRGRPGSTRLLTALDSYMPQLARTKSDLEDDFLYLCQRFNIPLPQVNLELHGEEPDCYWPESRLVVELDGDGNHGTPAQRRRDRRKDMKLRSHGLAVVRYDSDQVNHDAATVAADVLAQIEQRTRTLAA